MSIMFTAIIAMERDPLRLFARKIPPHYEDNGRKSNGPTFNNYFWFSWCNFQPVIAIAISVFGLQHKMNGTKNELVHSPVNFRTDFMDTPLLG